MQVSLQNGHILLSSKSGKATVYSGNKVVIDSDKNSIEVDWPGEYEASGISVRGISASSSEIVFIMTVEEVRMQFPANVGLGDAEEQLKDIGDIDVVFVFAEASSWLAKEWKKYFEELDPRMVVFGENGEKTLALQKELGVTGVEVIEKCDISQKTLPSDKTQYVSLAA